MSLILNALQKEIFLKRYAFSSDETWDKCARRISHIIAQVEQNGLASKWEEKFYSSILEGDFMPGGRILFGAGRRSFNMLNCFVLNAEDNVQSIGECIKNTYTVSCAGGGIGFNFSEIRPKGDDIQNIKWSSPGSVSIMKMINEIGEHVRSGKNRRTALIAILNIDHPDLMEFLHVKLNLSELNNFNISVAITNKFLKAVKENKNWNFSFNGRHYDFYALDRISSNKEFSKIIHLTALNEEDAIGRAMQHRRKTQDDIFENPRKVDLKAKDIWNILIKNAWQSGEPGLYNIDLANSFTNVAYFEKLLSTNPCQPADATILTPDGIKTIGDINIGDKIWSGTKWTNVINKVNTGIKPIFKFNTTAGFFIGTKEHRVLSNGEKIEVQYAESIDRSVGSDIVQNVTINPQDVMDGLVIGDGTIHKASNDLVLLCIGSNDQDYFHSEIQSFILKERPGIHDKVWEIQTTIQANELPKTYLRSIPKRFFHANIITTCGFLRGLYTANGSVVANRVTLKSASFELIRQVQLMLSAIGIRSYYTSNKEHDVEFDNGVYLCKESYDLNISTDRRRFRDLIGFIQIDKTKRLNNICDYNPGKSKETFEISSIEYIDDEQVFDLTVECESHTYWTGGLMVSNCGEVPLAPFSNCCLGHINLANMYDENQNDVNWKKLASTIRIGIRFLDNVLSANYYPLPECKIAGERSRRIGLGVTGLHYFLIKLGYNYGNQKCLEFLDRLFSTIRNESYLASIELAKKKGSFPAFDADKYTNSDFCKELPPRIQRDIRKYGIRNAVMLTIAPCGTNSMVLGVSSGIEPIFAPVYIRRFRDGNIWREELVIDKLFAEFYSQKRNIEFFQGAHDITVEQHIAVQATIQKYIDSSISKTTNLPEDYPVEKLSDIILEYAPFVKGFTIYRTNSRGQEPLQPVKVTSPEELDEIMKKANINVASKEACISGKCDL